MSYRVDILKSLLVQQEKSLIEIERDMNRLQREIEAATQEFERFANAIAATRAELRKELEVSNDDNR